MRRRFQHSIAPAHVTPARRHHRLSATRPFAMNSLIGLDKSSDSRPLTIVTRPSRPDRRHPAVDAVVAATLLVAVGLAWSAHPERIALGPWSTPTTWILIVAAATVGTIALQRRTAGTAPPRTRSTLIVGSGPLAIALRDTVVANPGRTLLGFVDSWDRPHTSPSTPVLGSLDQLDEILMRNVVDDVVVALPIKSQYDRIQAVIRLCEEAGVSCTHSAHLFAHTIARHRVRRHATSPMITLTMVPEGGRVVAKRLLDVSVAIVAAMVLLPLLLATAIAVKVTSPGPVLFVQQRYGHRKRRFDMYKFRTMVRDAEALLPSVEALNEASGHAFKIRRDPRLTPIGSLLRRWSLDELPQLWNVVRGDMSLVGPRPMSVRDVSRFSDPWLMRRFSVRPGLTGLWQVSGRCNLTFDQWMALDLRYIDRWSLGLDLWILVKTIPAVLRRSGAA